MASNSTTAAGGGDAIQLLSDALQEAVAMLEVDPEASEPGSDLYTWLRTTPLIALAAACDGISPESGGAAEPVATVQWYDPEAHFGEKKPHKIIDASLAFLDSAPLGTKLYAHPPVAAETGAEQELAHIRALLLGDQGADDGSQILPDFDAGMSVAAMVSRCVHLLEQRRDVLDAYKLKSAETRAKRSRLEAEGWSQASVVSCYWISGKPDHELVPVVNLDLRKLYEATHELAASPPPPAGDGETEPSDLGRLSAGAADPNAAVHVAVAASAMRASEKLGFLKAAATACSERKAATLPAAPRKGPSEEEIAEALFNYDVDVELFKNGAPEVTWSEWIEITDKDHGTVWRDRPEKYRARARAIAALFADRGETRGEDWRPIETAPKDGTWVLLRFAPPFHDSTENGIAKGMWGGAGWWLSAIWAASIAHAEPVEWRPLPSPHRAAPDQGGTDVGGRL